MSKMEELRFMADLNWKIMTHKFEYIFSKDEFFVQFLDFMNTETYKKWLTKKEGKQYLKWQSEQE